MRWGIGGYSSGGAGAASTPDIPPAPDAGRGVAKRRRDRRAEVRRLPPSRAHSNKAALSQQKKRSENSTASQANPNATGYMLEVGLGDCSVAMPAGLDRNRRRYDVHAIACGETFIVAPGRNTGGRGRTRPTEPQAERSRAQRSGPDLPWPFRAISGRRRNRVAPGRSNAESGATLFPVPAHACITGAIASRDTIPAVATRASHWL